LKTKKKEIAGSVGAMRKLWRTLLFLLANVKDQLA